MENVVRFIAPRPSYDIFLDAELFVSFEALSVLPVPFEVISALPDKGISTISGWDER